MADHIDLSGLDAATADFDAGAHKLIWAASALNGGGMLAIANIIANVADPDHALEALSAPAPGSC